MLTVIIIGVALGSIYGLTATGLLLTFRTSGVFNLAHGAMGMFGTYVFWQMRDEWGWPFVPSLLLAVVVVAPLLGALSYLVAFRWVRGRPVAYVLVASIGILGAFQGLAVSIWGSGISGLGAFTPIFPTRVLHIGGLATITGEQIGIIVVAASLMTALAWALQRTRLGLVTRAVVDSGELAEMQGLSTLSVQLWVWALATAIATLSSIMIAPLVLFDPIRLTLVVIPAVTCVVVARLRSIPLTYGAGLALGLTESALGRYLEGNELIEGIKLSAAFFILYGAVVLGSTVFNGFREIEISERQRSAVDRTVPPSFASPLVVALVALAGVLPLLSTRLLFLITAGVIASIMFQGFVLITGLGAQVSLCQASLMGVGAIIYARAVVDWGLPWPLALMVAPLFALVFGLVIGLPAIRIKGLPLGLMTLAFALFMDAFMFNWSAFSGNYTGVNIPRPEILGLDLRDDLTFAYFALVLAVLAAAAVRNLASGRTGRILSASRSSDVAVESLGASVRTIKIWLFLLAAVLAGLAGSLQAMQVQLASAIQYNVSQSLLFLLLAVVGGTANPQGAIVAGLLLYGVPDLFSTLGIGDYYQAIFGSATILVLALRRGGLGDQWSRVCLSGLRMLASITPVRGRADYDRANLGELVARS